MPLAERRTEHQVGNLPVEVTSLIGRRGESIDVRQRLASSRLVTLTGVGGVGKTRLALHVARKVQRAFADGVRLVELAELAEPDLLPLTVMQAVGVHSPEEDPVRALTTHLRTKQLLLVMDNCEHLIDGCAVLVGRLLSSCPGLRVLATSREPLRVGGEHVYAVSSLSVPATHRSRTSEDPAISEAVALFVERAAAVSPGFGMSPANEVAVAELCQRLDGLPLAIELAAVRMRAVSPSELLARLDEPYRLLVSGSRAVAPRHQTLRAAVDWSYELCSPEERILWERLSVFAGSVDLDAAEQVCTGDDLAEESVFDALTGLVDKSVLIRDDVVGRPRYRELDTIREYGLEQLKQHGDIAALKLIHRDYYLQLALRFEVEWFGADQSPLLTRMRAEHANLRLALDSFVSEEDRSRTALRMAAALWCYWVACGRQREGRHWLDRALAKSTEPTVERVAALWTNGYLAMAEGNAELGAQLLRECRTLSRQLGDEAGLARATHMLGVAQHNLGNIERGVKLLQEGVEREERLSDVNPFLTLAKNQLAWAYCISAQADRAAELLEGCRATCEAHREGWLLSWVLVFLGLARWIQGETPAAVRCLRDAIRHKRTLDDVLGLAVAMEILAWSALSEGNTKWAARLLGASQTMWEPLGEYLGGFELRRWSEQCADRARVRLGTLAFDAAVQSGKRLTSAEAIACALGERDQPQSTPTTPRELVTLTPRETEIAHLLVKGMTNKEIANALVIAPRTVDSHVEHILTKLGLTSRTQVAALFTK